MGELITLDLQPGAPELSLPWIITFSARDDDDEWGIVCGPYERAHAMALAETVVADEDLIAMVEPVLPHVSVAEIRNEIEKARAAAEAGYDEGEGEFGELGEEEADELDEDELGEEELGEEEVAEEEVAEEELAEEGAPEQDLEVAVDMDYDEAEEEAEGEGEGYEYGHATYEVVEPTPPPSPEEVRAGFARIAARLSAGA